MKFKSIFFIALSTLYLSCDAQKSTVWEDFVIAQKTGETSILPDFSYAGYKYSQEPIPKVKHEVFDITNFGAIPNDLISDKDALEKAIAAASKNGKGIIYFPKGKYYINTGNDELKSIIISSSNIVFRGENREESVLFFDSDLPPAEPKKLWTCPSAIKVKINSKNTKITNVTGNTKRESFVLKVEDASKINAGDWIIVQVKNNSKDLVKYDIEPLIPEPEWKAITIDGVEVNERHQVAEVNGNKITLAEPMHYDINAKHGWEIYKFEHLSEVGFENLTFEGNWTKEFVHHRSAQDDGGWSILSISNAVNSWIKDCTFRNVSNAASINGSAASTALNITIEGKIGHSAIHAANGSTGILIAKVNDIAGMHHAVGVGGGSTTGTVVWRCNYPAHTCFEAHASQPRCTLFDKVEGGFMAGRAGGARFNLPNHGRNLVLWNYKEIDEAESNFRFWAVDTWYWKIVPPIIVGFHGSGTTFKEDEVHILESLGTPVKQESLFEEQLKLRLGSLPEWINIYNK